MKGKESGNEDNRRSRKIIWRGKINEELSDKGKN